MDVTQEYASRTRLMRNIGFAWLSFVAITCFATCAVRAAEGSVENSFWEISSRNLPENLVNFEVEKLSVQRFVGNHWQASNCAEFSQPLVPTEPMRTIIYVHGNWTTAIEARQRGLIVYQACRQRAQQPFRFVIYSWPSEREEGFARDIIGKKSRLATDSYYLASLLQRLDANSPVGLLGFSFGGAVVCGALHVEAGGQLEGRSLPKPAGSQPLPIRVSLSAPAFDRNALIPGGMYELALTRTDKVVNLFNSIDPVLKRFRFFERDAAPVAAGFAGILDVRLVGLANPPMAGALPLSSHVKIVQYDCGNAIGRTHAEAAYLEKCPVFQRSIENLLGF